MRSLAVYTIILIAAALTKVDAFTAGLPRPWDENTLTRRHQTTSFIKLYVAELEKSNAENSNQQDGNEEVVNKEEEIEIEELKEEEKESMILQEPEIHDASSPSDVVATDASIEAVAASSKAVSISTPISIENDQHHHHPD